MSFTWSLYPMAFLDYQSFSQKSNNPDYIIICWGFINAYHYYTQKCSYSLSPTFTHTDCMQKSILQLLSLTAQMFTFWYAARRNSIGFCAKLMAWPKNGIVEGMWGGNFSWNKKYVQGNILINCNISLCGRLCLKQNITKSPV